MQGSDENACFNLHRERGFRTRLFRRRIAVETFRVEYIAVMQIAKAPAAGEEIDAE